MKELLQKWLLNRWALAAAVVLLGAGGWAFFSSGAVSGKLTYDTEAVDKGDVENSVSSSGSVSPLVTVIVGSEVSGRLTEVLVDFNSKVSKNQLLAVIDPSTFKTKLRSAEADMVVQDATIGSREVDLSTSQVNLAQAERDEKRVQQLFDKGLASQNELEKSRNSFEQAQNSTKIAEANLRNARSQRVKVQANLDQARIDLSRTEIRSPVDGVVISRKVDTGQTVAASMQAPELFQIAQDLSKIRIETKVDEADIGSIKEEKTASFTVDAYPDRSFNGRVAQVRISGTASQSVVTYSVMVEADNPGQVLLPGMTANVKIITEERKDVLRVPSAALRFRPAGADASVLAMAGAESGARSGGQSGQSGQSGGPGGGQAGGFAGMDSGGPGGGQGGGQSAAGQGSGQRSGGSGRGTQTVEMTPEVMEELGLSEEQQKRVTEAMKSVMASADSSNQSSSNPLGGGLPNMRAMFGNNNTAQLTRQRIQNALAGILNEEQLQKYSAMASNRSERSGTVYVLDAAGKPEEKRVRVGLADDSHTEIISGLAEGDMIIVRARAEAA